MFTKLIHPFESRVSPWLGTNERLFTLKLANIKNSFDAHSLWDYRYGGNKEILESATGQNDLRLRTALDVHRCITSEVDKRGWQSIVEKTFTDVVLWMPQTVWQEDIELGGNNLVVLADNLARLHQEDLGAELLDSRLPSYAIMPDANVSDGEIVFQFGLGVFVPRENDRLAAEVYVKIKDRTDWQPLPEWIFWENGRMIKRQAGIYRQQIGLTIGADTKFCAVKLLEKGKSSLWFSHGKGSIFINYALGSEQFAFGDGVHVSKGQIFSLDKRIGKTIFEFKDPKYIAQDASDIGEILLLKVERIQKEKRPAEPAIQQDEKKPHSTPTFNTIRPLSEAVATISFRDGDTVYRKTGIQGPHLFLEGYALPRIDKMKVGGLQSWVLWLDETAKPVNQVLDDPEKEAQRRMRYLTFSGGRDQSSLFVRKPLEKEFAAIENFPWQFEDERGFFYEVISPPEKSYYLGILQIPQPELFFQLKGTPMVLGRGDSRSENNPDIDLDILSHRESLKWAKGQEREGTYLGAISLSREHVRVELKDGNVRVVQLSETSPAFGLKHDGEVVRLEPSSNKEMSLEPGGRLLIGCCLLKFENGQNQFYEKE